MNKTPSEKGYELERKMEKVFQLNGYKTKRNVVLEGKSGGRHEIDILAEKSDGLTTFRMMVECKAWNKPIDKDVVSKTAYVARDLGLNKAIIISLQGWRLGAEKSAQELGVELWDKNKIERRLGKVVIAELETYESKRIFEGFPLRISEKIANTVIDSASRGFFGFINEDKLWFKQVWLPIYLFELSCSKREGIISRKIKTTKLWNIYEALQGSWLASFKDKPILKEIKSKRVIQQKITNTKIKKNIITSFERKMQVVTPKARARYTRKLNELGIPKNIIGINIDNIFKAYYPLYIALFKTRQKERIITVDGYNGEVNKTLGKILTINLSYIKESLKNKKN